MTDFSLTRKEEIYAQYRDEFIIKTDYWFAWVFVFQWVLGMVLVFAITPLTWIGDESQVHIHVYSALFIGGITSALPILLVLKKPGHVSNRYVIASAQMVYSILLIHLTGGRIETHFHVFVSLAFLSFYRDIGPILLATLITTADHFVRGMFFPESVYGVLSATPFRAIEHASWVVFEDIVLYLLVKDGLKTIDLIAVRQAQTEEALSSVERKVRERTEALEISQAVVLEQQSALVGAAKMSALGEMAGGVAHEINTPLAIISMRVEQLEESLQDEDFKKSDITSALEVIRRTTDRIAKIVKGLKFFARDGKKSSPQKVTLKELISDTFSFCRERFTNHGIILQVVFEPGCEELALYCHSVEISQVILNLLNNAFDAIENNPEKWVRVEISAHSEHVEIAVVDSGNGLTREVQEKMMQPFFTTKEVGKGTGLGLSISRGIVQSHGGQLKYDSNSPHTRFVIELPAELDRKKAG